MAHSIRRDDGESWTEAGAGEALVFVHGIGSDLTAFSPQMEALSRDYRALSWSLPGYGGGALTVARADAEHYARRLARFLDARAVTRAHVVGHSMGALVLAALARVWSGAITTCTFAQPVRGFAHLAPDERERIRLGRIEDVRRLGMAEFCRLRGASVLGPAATPDMAAAHLAMMRGIPEAAYLQAWEVICGADLFASAGDMSCPTQILYGSEDKVAPPAACRALAEIWGVEALTELAGVGHSAPVEASETLTRMLQDFLSRHAGRGA